MNYKSTGISKEPRPVYAPELDLLGFDQYWNYDRQQELPYMWAEANHYWYRGRRVASLKGGNLYTPPEILLAVDDGGAIVEPEPEGKALRPVDIAAMVEANREIMAVIEESTRKKILQVYEKFRKKLDCFHVAFSGGKDSIVLLDLVKKALPQGSFIVLFADTGMEFPDTYAIIEKTRLQCEAENIPFHIARADLEPETSWRLFGPPSRVLRWCCSVHKSAPQILKLREILGKEDYKGLDFVGVRAHESNTRSKYTYLDYGKKQKGQYNHNPILEWTSAEIWLYMYSTNLLINEAYKKGNSRAGCLLCPVTAGTSNFFREKCYGHELAKYTDIIADLYIDGNNDKEKIESYISNGGWNARKNGRDLNGNPFRCIEKIAEGKLAITVIEPSSSWEEWIQTIGRVIQLNKNRYAINWHNDSFEFSIKTTSDGYIVTLAEHYLKQKPVFGKIFKQVFRKAAYCSRCQICGANCKFGCISFSNNQVRIRDCLQCLDCHKIDSGCILFHSLRHPQGGGDSLKSLNSFADHAPKLEWLQSFFRLKDAFFSEHTLGSMMYDMFRRFLRDASLNEKNQFTPFAALVDQIGWDSDIAWGLIFINLAYKNPQIEWYIENLDLNQAYPRSSVEEMLEIRNVKPKDAKSIVKSYARLVSTPLGTSLGFGHVTGAGELVRTKCRISDLRVVLYGLFKFAEQCGDYKEFTLSLLLNDSIERDGLSPSRIFGLAREEMQSYLQGLSAKYPDFIHASFTHDLDKIALSKDKTSEDVLELFRREYCHEPSVQ